MKGRKTKPSNIHQLHGTYREDRHGGGIQIESVLPDPPAGLPEAGLEEWLRVAPELHKANLLTNLDLAALEAYCRLFARWRMAEEMLATADDMVFEAKSGYMAQSAYLNISNACVKQMHSIMADFGMTPAARARMKAVDAGPKQQDLFEDFMNSKKKRQNG